MLNPILSLPPGNSRVGPFSQWHNAHLLRRRAIAMYPTARTNTTSSLFPYHFCLQRPHRSVKKFTVNNKWP